MFVYLNNYLNFLIFYLQTGGIIMKKLSLFISTLIFFSIYASAVFSSDMYEVNTINGKLAPGYTQAIGGASLWVNSYGYDAGGWRVEYHPRKVVDVNGDGKADIVGFGEKGVYVSLSTSSGFTSPELWVNSYGNSAGGWKTDSHPRLMGDVNGDGLSDIVGFGNAGVYVSLSDGETFSEPKLWINTFGYNAGGWRVEKHPRILADVNGDNKVDIVGFGNAGVYVSLSTGYDFMSAQLWTSTYGYNAGGWRIESHPRMVVDVNGDQMADVIGFGNAGVYVSVSKATKFRIFRLCLNEFGHNAGGWRVNNHPRIMSDVNGDDIYDVVGFGNHGVNVSLSTGFGFNSPELTIESFGASSKAGGWKVDQHPRKMADVNGDGMDDVVGFANAGVYVSLSNGKGFESPTLWVNTYGYDAGGWRVDKHPRILADVNGDKMADIIGFGNAGVYVSLSNGLNQFE